MILFNDDPAFPFEVSAVRCMLKEGDLTDKTTGEKRHYNTFNVQCTWVGLDGLPAICLAKPVEGYRPDKSIFEKGARLRLAVTSSSSSGGMLTLRFIGVESLTKTRELKQ